MLDYRIEHRNPSIAGPPCGSDLRIWTLFTALQIQFGPGRVVLRGLNAGLNEGISCHPVVHGREIIATCRRIIPLDLVPNRRGSCEVDIRKGLDEAFGVRERGT